MIRFYKFALLVCLILVIFNTNAQVSVKDTSISFPMVSINYAYQTPGGDLAKRFGDDSYIGVNFVFKSKKNYLLGIEGNYFFGTKIKEDSILKNISTSDSNLINGNGEYADVRMYERGFLIMAKFGKMFPIIGPNPNSGLVILGGVGFMQHKIRIESPGNTVPQIAGEYVKGYDRLTNGLAVSEFVGYMHMGNNRLVSFYIGIECVQAWTQNRRSYNFDQMKRDTEKRLDLQYGIKIGWILPLYKRLPDKYYFN
jgi:hypothetical protein